MSTDDVSQHIVLQTMANRGMHVTPHKMVIAGFVVSTRAHGSHFGVKISHGPWITKGHSSPEAAWRRVGAIVKEDVWDVSDMDA